jgi:hypothetical protein
MTDVSDNEITFVVQGPVVSNGLTSTEMCLNSIRLLFPKCRIILSTWRDSDIAELSYDDLLLNDDPGPIISEHRGLRLANNLNRQILSTSSGLAEVATEYAVKLRSDATVTGRGFVEFFNAFPWRLQDHRIFQHRIVISKEFTRSPKSFVPFAYHPSDLFQFGLTKDLKLFWDIELVVGDRLRDYFLPETSKASFSMFDRFRYTTEQYLFLDLLKRTGRSVQLRDFSDVDESISDLSQLCLLNNFIPVEPELLGLEHAKFGSRAHRSLMEDCVGLREFTSWYASKLSGVADIKPLGEHWPKLPVSLRLERIVREGLKRMPFLPSLYAKRYLSR